VEATHVFMHGRTYEQPFLVTMSISTNKHRYKNKLLGLLLPPPWRKTLREISNFIVKILLYLVCIVSLMTDTFFKVELPFTSPQIKGFIFRVFRTNAV